MKRLHPKYERITEAIRSHWDARAKRFDEDPSHGLHSEEQHEAWLGLLARLAGTPPQRVLDVGCGTGFLALLFAELGHEVTGIDLSPQMLELAKKKSLRQGLKVEFRLENGSSLSDPNGSYDLVVARHVLWTLPDPISGVADWLRVLRPGGHLALIEEHFEQNKAKPKRHRSARSALAYLAYPGLVVLSRFVGRNRWPWLYARLDAQTYRRAPSQLPFFGGAPAQRIVKFLQDQGLREVTVEPLMSEELWGEAPIVTRYVVQGKR